MKRKKGGGSENEKGKNERLNENRKNKTERKRREGERTHNEAGRETRETSTASRLWREEPFPSELTGRVSVV